MSESLDAVDAKILDLIQHDAGLSVAEIAERVGLSSSPCWRRIKRLEDAGVILRRVTILDRERLGLTFEVYCTVKLSLPTKENLETFEQAIAKMPEVVLIAQATGYTVAQLVGTGTVADRVQWAARATNDSRMEHMRESLLHFLALDDYLDDQAIPATI